MSNFIILDRDGVINYDSDYYIKSVDEFVLLPGSLDAIASLYHSGFKVFVATNQSGIAKELFSLETLHAMHRKLQNLLADKNAKIEQFYYCPHGPDDHCLCRKPRPGLIEQIAREHLPNGLADLRDVYVIGDSRRDLQAGMKAGTKIALVKTGKGKRSLKQIADEALHEFDQLRVYKDLAEFTREFLSRDEKIN
jgi:D-glycero-D-manno-heptose 1,7-bisphosphate phosphatase